MRHAGDSASENRVGSGPIAASGSIADGKLMYSLSRTVRFEASIFGMSTFSKLSEG